jgi:hypothetical protein
LQEKIMPKKKRPRGFHCKVCKHQDRWRIELLRASGNSLDSLALKFDVSRDIIWRHWTYHVSAESKAGFLAGPSQLHQLKTKAAEENDSVIDYYKMTRTILVSQLMAAHEAGDGQRAALVAGRLTAVLDSIAKITGELGELARSTINIHGDVSITNSPQFAQIQAELLRALSAYPDARNAVVAALRQFDDEPAPTMKVIEHEPA